MATQAPRTPVPAPILRPWRSGLVGAARAVGTYIEDANVNTRWTGGISYRPELAYTRPGEVAEVDGPGSFITCPVDGNGVDETGQDAKTVRRGNPTVDWDPYVLYDGDGCTTLDSTYEEAAARASRSLELQTSHLIEQAFWTGEVNGLDFTANHPNVALASADADLPNGTTPIGVVSGMSLMIETLADLLGGARAMIHVPAELLPFLSFYGQIERVQFVNYTYGADHTIVAGTGYPGTDPDGATEAGVMWIYGTSPVEVRYTNIDVVPDGSNLYAAVNRETNDVDVIAERVALASFDLNAHVGIPICVPDPGPDCPTVS